MQKITSIVTDDTEHCYIHKKFLNIEIDAVHEHHMCHGTANRRLADKDRLVCGLCEQCHRLLHDQNYHDIDLLQDAEKAWIKHNNSSIESWIKRYGKNYL